MIRPGLDWFVHGDHIWMKSSEQVPPLSLSKNVLAFLSFLPDIRTNIATPSIYQRLNCFQYIRPVIFDGQENERGDMRPRHHQNLKRRVCLRRVGPILGETLVDIRRFANFARDKRTTERPKRVHFSPGCRHHGDPRS